ncbi:hypothetical protein ACHWQZ_G001272 [Mnemiopsis leidyi]
MRDGGVLILQTRSPDLFKSYSSTKDILNFKSDEDFLSFLLDTAQPVVSYVKRNEHRGNEFPSVDKHINGVSNGHVDYDNRLKKDTSLIELGVDLKEVDALELKTTQLSNDCNHGGEDCEKVQNGGISGSNGVPSQSPPKNFTSSETQTVNPAVSPRNNARIGGFRKRKLFLSPGRKEDRTKSNEELKSARVNAKVIEVVIKSEPEGAADDECARLFYPVDISCGQCPWVDRNNSLDAHHISQNKSVSVLTDSNNNTDFSKNIPLNKHLTVDNKNTKTLLKSTLFSDCSRPEEIKSTEDNSLSVDPPSKRLRPEIIKSFPCPSCPKKFPSAVSLWDHIRMKNSCPQTETISKCCFCPQNLERKVDLFRHISRVHGWLRCENCEDIFQASKAKEHITAHFKASRPEADQCFMCDFSHERPSTVMFSHAQLRHFKFTGILDESSFSTSVTCEACGLQFVERKALSLHQCRSHTKRTKLAGKMLSFQSKSGLNSLSKSERMSTSQSSIFRCDVCFKTLSSKGHLKRHQKKTASCKIKRELIKGVKPKVLNKSKQEKKENPRSSSTSCKICKKTFSNKANLKRHQASTKSCYDK